MNKFKRGGSTFELPLFLLKAMKAHEVQQQFATRLSGKYESSEIQQLYNIAMEDLAGITRMQLLTNPKLKLSEGAAQKLEAFIQGLEEGKPYQHLIGEVQFAGLKLKVGPQALIPRPETEELAYIIKEDNPTDAALQILDIGTGTGCLALACANFFHKSSVTTLDVSDEAISLASENAAGNDLQIDFVKGSILDAEQWPQGSWDIIVSNPPYIGESEHVDMDDLVTNHEPSLALFAPDDDVLVFYRKIMELSVDRLIKGGKVYLEINQKWGPETLKLYTDAGFKGRLLKDLSGNDRFVVAEKVSV